MKDIMSVESICQYLSEFQLIINVVLLQKILNISMTNTWQYFCSNLRYLTFINFCRRENDSFCINDMCKSLHTNFFFIRRGEKLKLKLSVTNLTRLSHFMVLWIYPFSHLVQPLYWNMSSGKNYLRVSLQQKRADGNFVLHFPIVDIVVKQILTCCIFV